MSIPVIGNGDVKNIDDINEMFDHTNCDGIMIGRAALGNPWFFAEVRKYMLNENFEDISIASIGDDMTNDQKEKAQEVVVPVILTRIASMAAFMFRKTI